MPCWAWVEPSFDASSAPDSCAQSHEILLNKGMKYWDSGLNARGLRTFIATAHIAVTVIGWMHSVKERRGQTQLSTKFVPKLSFMPRWNPMYFFFLFFKNIIPYVTEQGVWVSCPIEAQCTFSFCVFQISSFVWLHNTNGFGIEIMYDYYIVLKFMFLVVKLFSHSSIDYASFTILLPWTKHKQPQSHSKPKAFQN